MSCGSDADKVAPASPSASHRHSKDCSEVLDRVFFFLDNELDQADCSEIQQHLDECGPCLAKYDLERTVKSLVARSCSEVAPDALRQKVLLRIHQVRITITDQ
ncbi:MAG: rsrA [Marmoricola sp.]|jgi:mycothiol system anti-sigma-R factor|nr:rsrA [Marmoricola sp.]